MNTPQEHRELRELLGAHALGALPEDTAAGLRAHLDGCPACRAELAEIAPLADALRGVDPEALATLPTPPADLGERIRARIADERALVGARARRQQRGDRTRQRTRWPVAAAAAAVAVAGAVGTGTVIGRSTAPVPAAAPSPSPAPSPPVIPLEKVPVATASGVQAGQASVIAHSWGVEARFQGTGFTAGQVYSAAFRAADGRLLPAGEFLGTGAKTLTCNMQSALPRPDATAFLVLDHTGRTVLSAQLPT